jgi:hypothetical protein
MNPRLWREDADGTFPNADDHHYSKGGGGKGDAAMMMMMMQQQQQDNARAAMEKEHQRQQEAQAKEAQLLKEAEEKKQAKVKAESNLQKTLGSARSYGSTQNAQYGGDDRYGLLGLYSSLLSNAQSAIPEDDPNPSAYINANDLWSQAANTQRGTFRNKYKKQERDIYDTGFEKRAIADEMDDSVLQSILGDQQEQARSTLDRARSRGQLNDEAYGYAQSALGQQTASANNTLQGLGQTVLQKYRDNLLNRSRNLDRRVQEWDFGDDIDFERERGDYESDVTKSGTNLENDVRAAVGDRELYNMDLLLGKARNKAGTSNAPITAPLMSAFANTPSTATSTDALRTEDPTKKNVGVF